jgi:hypothetical protein
MGKLGRGVYLSQEEGMAGGFARKQNGGRIYEYVVRDGLRIADAEGKELIKIKKFMGLKLDDWREGKIYADYITNGLKKLGFDGVMSGNLANGLLIFDAGNVRQNRTAYGEVGGGKDFPLLTTKFAPRKKEAMEVRHAKQKPEKLYGKRSKKYVKGAKDTPPISVTPTDFLDTRGFVDQLGLNKKMLKGASIDPKSGTVRFSKKPDRYKATGGDASWIESADNGDWMTFDQAKTLDDVKDMADWDFYSFFLRLLHHLKSLPDQKSSNLHYQQTLSMMHLLQ